MRLEELTAKGFKCVSSFGNAHNLNGSYEDSYIFLMNSLDNLIYKLKGGT